jgi:hypothetical protein
MCGRKGAVIGFAVSTESAPLLGAAIDLLPPTPTASFPGWPPGGTWLPEGPEGSDDRPVGRAHQPAGTGGRPRDNPATADQPDRRWVDGWLHRSYLNFWTRNQ